jgi:hypothetical protein
MLSAAPMAPSSKSRAATVMVTVTVTAIWAVVAIITVGAAATTMVGGIAIDKCFMIAAIFNEKPAGVTGGLRI